LKIGILAGNAGRNSGGPEIYEVNLLQSLFEIDRKNEYDVFCVEKHGERTIGVRQDNVRYHHLWPSFRPVSMLTTLPLKRLRHRSDVFHATFVPPPLTRKPYLFTLVCFSMFQHPEFYPPAIRLRVQALMSHGARKAGLLLCISKNVRDLYAEKFRISPDRLAVTYLGKNEMFRPLESEAVRVFLKETYGIEGPYFLVSGRWEQRKNILGTLRAFSMFKKETRFPHKLVFTGSRTWIATEAEKLIEQLGLGPDVIDAGKSPLPHLPYLYGGADALVYASFWEGFGLPIVEAMACGTPVITSNISSMPEVAGSCALLVDPYSVEAIAGAMHSIAADRLLKERLGKEGLARASGFTWNQTAKDTLNAYKQFAAAGDVGPTTS
jgi:glycosyltransferase involved in cell wall biosynthesis